MRVIVEDGTHRVTIDGTQVTGLAKSEETWDGTSIAGLLVKSEAGRRFTLHCAYPALKPDTTVAADGYRDYASPETIERTAWRFIKSPQVGLWHAAGTDGAGTVVESYVYRGPDWTISTDGSDHVIKAGDWLVGIQWSPETWEQLVLKKRIGGVSIQGTATRRRPAREALTTLRT